MISCSRPKVAELLKHPVLQEVAMETMLQLYIVIYTCIGIGLLHQGGATVATVTCTYTCKGAIELKSVE